MKLMVIRKEFIIISILMVFYMLVWRLEFNSDVFIGTVCAIILTFIIVMMYMKDIKKFYTIIKKEN